MRLVTTTITTQRSVFPGLKGRLRDKFPPSATVPNVYTRNEGGRCRKSAKRARFARYPDDIGDTQASIQFPRTCRTNLNCSFTTALLRHEPPQDYFLLFSRLTFPPALPLLRQPWLVEDW